MAHVIGVDVSTTATKAVMLDESGGVLGVGAAEYGYDTPQSLWAEQDPSLWWTGTIEAIRSVLARTGVRGDQVSAVGLTGQMHGAVLLDRAAQVLRPAILWNDQRTGPACDHMRDILGGDLVRITGNDAMTGFTAPKLVWVKDNEPAVWERVDHVLLPKDFVRHRLTGDFATDVADGSGTQLFDLGRRTWSDRMLSALDIAPEWMPAVFEGPDVTGVITRPAAGETGLIAGTPVVAGGGDQAANAVGLGVLDPGAMAMSLGTSGVLFAPTDAPLVESAGRVHAFCHAVPGRWHLMGVMLSAAGSLRWLRDSLAPGRSFEDLVRGAGEVGAADDGLFFLPYLTGERTPHADPLARGAFVGLTIRHDLRHMTRAVLEGVAFGLRDGLDLMEASGLQHPNRIRASGGGTASGLWRQIVADVLDSEIALVDTTEGAAYGAAILATVGAGWYRSTPEAAKAFVRIRPAEGPSSDRDRYAELRQVFAGLYPALVPTFHTFPA
jgi:xylulokinase